MIHIDENKKIYRDLKERTEERIKSNSECRDKAILTLSTSLFGFLFIAIQWLSTIHELRYRNLYFICMIMLGLSIITVIVSYYTGNFSLKKSIREDEVYYLNKQENEDENEQINKPSLIDRINEGLNYASGTFFILGIIFALLFTTYNITEMNKMTDNFSDNKTGETVFVGDSVDKLHRELRATNPSTLEFRKNSVSKLHREKRSTQPVNTDKSNEKKD